MLVASNAVAAEVGPEELRRGLVTTYRDGATPAAEVMRLETSVGLTLKAGESPHPRLSANGGVYRWRGYVLVLRAGDYRFRAVLRGNLRLSLDGKEVFAAESRDATATKESGEVPLKEGVLKFEAEFMRLSGDARLELWWSSPFFRTEPIPFDLLGHLPKELPKRLADDHDRRGRLRGGARLPHLPCACRRGRVPPLRRSAPRLPTSPASASRVHAGWLLSWLEDPQKYGLAAGCRRCWLTTRRRSICRRRLPVVAWRPAHSHPSRPTTNR
jgi:hypothetical protein